MELREKLVCWVGQLSVAASVLVLPLLGGQVPSERVAAEVRIENSVSLDCPWNSQANTVWCATIPLAWAELKSFLGSDVLLEGECDMLTVLNRDSVERDSIDTDSTYTFAGIWGSPASARVHGELERMFGVVPDLRLLSRPPRIGSLVAFGYMRKSLHFQYLFSEHAAEEEGAIEFSGPDQSVVRVPSFGIRELDSNHLWQAKVASQVRVVRYGGPAEFTVLLRPDSRADEIILAVVQPGATLKKTIRAAMTPDGLAQDLGEGDTFLCPRLDFDVELCLEELLGRGLLNQGFEGWPIEVAAHRVRFSLNGSGADMSSEFDLEILEEKDHTPRRLICDRPFLLLLKKPKANGPYFALWVADPAALLHDPAEERGL